MRIKVKKGETGISPMCRGSVFLFEGDKKSASQGRLIVPCPLRL